MACGSCGRVRGPVKVIRSKSGVTIVRAQTVKTRQKPSAKTIKRRIGVKLARG